MTLNEILKYLVSLGAVALTVLCLAPFAGGINPTTVALALLLVILFSATIFGSRQALVASIVAVLCFNFFFLPPFLTLHIEATENWITFATFLITALVAGQLSNYARRKGDEAERRRIEIERLYKELQDAFEQASEAEALRRSENLKSSLLDAITHDLRTPLTSIKASATSLLESKTSKLLDEEGEIEFLQIINEESDRLNKSIEGMVDLAQIETRTFHLRKNWTTIQHVVEMAVEKVGAVGGEHTISVDLAQALPAIYVDAASISEAVYLLLGNACRYSLPGSNVRISAREVADTIEIYVDDQGRGVPLEYREKVFQKFVRVPEPMVPSTGEGLGLGLAIVKGIIEAQAGKIWIEDAEKPFVTRFAFSLPIEQVSAREL